MDILFILNDDACGDEGAPGADRSETALRLAAALLRAEDAVVRIFLANDAARLAAVRSPAGERGGSTPGISTLVNAGAQVAVSDVAMLERRIASSDLVIGAEPAAISTLAAWCLESDRLLVF